MAINFSPKVGQILECDYGDYERDAQKQALSSNPDRHLPPEMVKRRLVVVLNGKLNHKACIVVPLSTTQDLYKLGKGFHVEILAALIPALTYFGQALRWAKADMVEQVSFERLHRPRTYRQHEMVLLPSDAVAAIQIAIVKSINGSRLLRPAQPAPPADTPTASN